MAMSEQGDPAADHCHQAELDDEIDWRVDHGRTSQARMTGLCEESHNGAYDNK